MPLADIQSFSSGNGLFVKKSGDTMTGNLIISKASPSVLLSDTFLGVSAEFNQNYVQVTDAYISSLFGTYGGTYIILADDGGTANSTIYADGTSIYLYPTIDINPTCLFSATTATIGPVGDIILGDSTLRTMYPQTDQKIDLGNSNNRFLNLYITNIVADTTTGIKLCTSTTQKLGVFNKTPAVQQTDGANLTNNVTSGGTNNTIANFTDLVTYANDAATIRDNIYQLARKVKIIGDALRTYGWLS